MLLLISLFQTEQLRLDKVTLQIQCTIYWSNLISG